MEATSKTKKLSGIRFNNKQTIQIMKNLLCALLLTLMPTMIFGQDSLLCVGRYWSEDEGNVMLKKFASEWNDLESWEERASQIKKGIIKGMQFEKMPEIKGNFNTILRDKKEMDGYTVENIAIESFPGFYVTGNLYRPTEKEDKYAGILSPHGHMADKRFTHYIQKRAAVLARMGAIVFAYDMVGYAESQQVEHKMSIAMLLQTYNSQRVLEYLLSRPDIDPERIGMTGGSGGATQTFLLAAIDDRIKVSAPVVQVSAHFFGGCVCESGMPVHKSANHQTSNVEIAALCAPRPMLIVSDGADWTRNTPRVEYPYIQKVYALYDGENRVENVHLPSEKHDYGYSKRTALYNFFGHHLDLDMGNVPYDEGYQEDFVTILPREKLQVFTKEAPMPKSALQGNDAVQDYLDIRL